MARDRKNLEVQAEDHPLVDDGVLSLPRHCLALVHLKAYETAAEFAAGKDALDIGCNHGYGTAMIGKGARSVVGVDVSEQAVAAARSRHPDVKFEKVSGGALPFPDGSFDFVTFFQVLEHLDDAPAFLADVARVLRPGGRAMLTTPNRVIRIEPGGKPWNRFHVKEYDAAELKATLAKVFPEVEVRGLHGPAEFDQIEFARVADARRMHSLRQGGSFDRFRGRITKKSRRAKARLVEGLLRIPFVAGVQRRRFARYSTAVLAYTAENTDTALDLMAIGRK
jgi:SAM-dependent methyltransferase